MELKIKVIKTNSFPGDTFRRIEINGIPIMGISKNYSKLWECDLNSKEFKTIADAKEYAIKLYNINL